MNKLFLILTLIVCVSSCKNANKEHGHENDEGGLKPLAYTLYSDKMEIFVEFKPLIVGKASKLAAHFTVLGEQFTALSEGTVTISLIVGDKGLKNSANAPSVPGIYRLTLTPKTAGIGKLVFDIQTKTFTDQIIIDSVKVYADEKTALAEQPEEYDGTYITYLKEQAWKVEFANALVKKQGFNDVIKTSGQILSAPGDEVLITAKAKGIVLFSGTQTITGSHVSTGTALFVVTGGDLAEGNIDASYKAAKANYDKAKADYDRLSILVKDKSVSEKEFLQAKVTYENAQIAFNTIAKNYSSKGQTIYSTMDGFVKNISVSAGQFVEAGTPLATISKNKKLVLQANVSQQYFDKLPGISSANFKSNTDGKVYDTKELNGQMISYGKSASANSPFIPIIFEIDNTGNLISGWVVEVYLKSFPIPDAMVIPASSLIEEQGNFYVYVQTGGESFQKREVKIGASDGINVQVLSGVAEGERVVTKGAYQIKLATAAGTLPAHGHEH